MTENHQPETDGVESLKGRKILLVNHSDTLGGAAVVTFRLLQALRKRGLDVRMLVYTKTSGEECVDVVGKRFNRGMRFCMERLWMLLRGSIPLDKIFQVSTGDFAINIHSHPWAREADIVCLNWTNQGLMNLEGIKQLHLMGKKIVWTLHDMWAFTGICHHAYECDHYRDQCGGCMFVSGGGSFDDISHRVWQQKMKIYSEVPITFVTVSKWLEKKARSSSLLCDKPVTTIHNAFPVENFYTTPPAHIDSLLSLTKPNLILFGAARLDDPIKGLQYTIDALNIIFDNYPAIANSTAVYFFGSMKNPEMLDKLRMSHRWLGMVRDQKILRYLYASAKVVLSTSLCESLQGTLIEGQAAGAIPVTFGGDGREDIVTHLDTGYIARYKDPQDIANGVLWALGSEIDRDYLHRSVAERFGAQRISDRYIELFNSLLQISK
ncbi:MAG: glycosyltransferase [Muribaculaceae bacterium]|nr:glycosyltransferase [Muribaculaceae bacterium]